MANIPPSDFGDTIPIATRLAGQLREDNVRQQLERLQLAQMMGAQNLEGIKQRGASFRTLASNATNLRDVGGSALPLSGLLGGLAPGGGALLPTEGALSAIGPQAAARDELSLRSEASDIFKNVGAGASDFRNAGLGLTPPAANEAIAGGNPPFFQAATPAELDVAAAAAGAKTDQEFFYLTDSEGKRVTGAYKDPNQAWIEANRRGISPNALTMNTVVSQNRFDQAGTVPTGPLSGQPAPSATPTPGAQNETRERARVEGAIEALDAGDALATLQQGQPIQRTIDGQTVILQPDGTLIIDGNTIGKATDIENTLQAMFQ